MSGKKRSSRFAARLYIGGFWILREIMPGYYICVEKPWQAPCSGLCGYFPAAI